MEDQVQVGDWITVVEWTSHRDTSWCGDCLKVVAICWPYLVVQEYKFGQPIHSSFKLDFRKVELMKLEPSYVSALNPKQQP